MDAVSYDLKDIVNMARKFSECGANVIQIPDTRGNGYPERIRNVVKEVMKISRSKIEIHCHNDRGFAITNTIAGIEAGADYADATIMGIGERNGIADLASLVAYLNDHGLEKINMDKIEKIYEIMFDMIIKKIGYKFFNDNRPLFGKNVKTVTAGTHSGTFPSEYYSFNVYAGRNVISNALKMRGITVSNDKISELVAKIKNQSVETGMALGLDDVMKIYGEMNESS
ncbi:MAG: hypothetical protein ACP5UV_03180 [Thermoplasmata archaeon]